MLHCTIGEGEIPLRVVQASPARGRPAIARRPSRP